MQPAQKLKFDLDGIMKQHKQLIVGSDHAGLRAKNFVRDLLVAMSYAVEDIGTHNTKSVDYPDYARKVAEEVLKGKNRRGILVCGSGIGAAIAANKIPGIRAAVIHNVRDARLSREHNDTNLLVLAGWGFNRLLFRRILRVWLSTQSLGGRHRRRIRKISQIEKIYQGKTRKGRTTS